MTIFPWIRRSAWHNADVPTTPIVPTTMPESSNRSDLERLERFLLGAEEVALDPALVEAHGLAGYASARSSAPVPARFRAVYMSATARHIALKAELAKLVRAWNEAGIEVLVFKGFYLAEFVYDTPGQRLYSDVDLLMAPEHTLRASQLARDLGWLEPWRAQEDATMHTLRDPLYQGHEVMQLLHPKLSVQLDVHRRLAHNNHNRLPFFRVQERLTRAAWQASHIQTWEGAELRVLEPVDSVLIGLVVNRCWSSDDWHLRAHDFLDFEMLRRHGVTLAALQRRARDLGCARTLQLFLQRCNPFAAHLDLSPPSLWDRQRWNSLIAAERGHRYLEKGMMSAAELPGELLEPLRELPNVLRVLALLRRHDLESVVEKLERPIAEPRTLSYREWRRLKRGVHRSLRLLGVNAATQRLATAVALFAALRARACPATLHFADSVSAAAGEQSCWLELDGQVLNLGGTVLGSERCSR